MSFYNKEKKKDNICIVCHIETNKYKCPICKNYYCSIQCFKEHKKVCNINNIIKNEIIKNNEEVRPLNLDENEDYILSQNQLKLLKENKSIMNKIKNKKLRKIMIEIDKAKYKKRTLEKIMNNDSDFKDFTYEILNTLGFIKNHEFILHKHNKE